MHNLKLIRQEIRNRINQQTTAEILSFVGFEVDKSFKFKLRDENTASASISKKGSVTDFGNGKYYSDPVAILYSFKNTPLKDATLYVAKLLSIDTDDMRYKL